MLWHMSLLHLLQEMNLEFAELWKPLAGFESDQMTTFEKAGYYSMAVNNVPGLRIVNFNSNYWSEKGPRENELWYL